MRRYCLIAALIAIASPAAARIDIPPPVSVTPLPPGTETRPVKLAKIVVDLRRGETYGQIQRYMLCVGGEPLIWKGGRIQLDPQDFNEVFKDELDKLGFDVVGMSANLFDERGDNRAEFLVGGTIRSMMVDVCFPYAGIGNALAAKGSATMEVEWQVYNWLDHRIVATATTRTGFRQAKSDMGGVASIVFAAFGENVRALVATGKLQKALVGRPADFRVAHRPNSKYRPLRLVSGGAVATRLSDAVGSTVMILSGDGHGSGVLLGQQGYVLTNQHVVGNAAYVKIRWSDGAEGLGEVVRVDPGRDVALVKCDPRGRPALRLRAAEAGVGTPVFAIGAPLQQRLQNSVTRGIVSAHRVLDGYDYIQSDAAVAPGNSGGPLVDDNGNLIGITVSAMTISSTSMIACRMWNSGNRWRN